MIRTRRKSVAGALAAALLATLALTGCSTRAEADQIVLYYKAGAGDNRAFDSCILPGKSGKYPVDDVTFPLPTSLRTWNIRPEGGDTSDWIKTSSKPASTGAAGPEMGIYAKVEFYLNTDCSKGKNSPIVQFWERTGRRYAVAKDGSFNEAGWNTMLKNTLIPAEESALRKFTKGYTSDELDVDLNGAYDKIEVAAAQVMQEMLNESVGGSDYFCGPAYRGGAEVAWTESKLDAEGRVVTEERKGTCPPVKIEITDINYADPEIAKQKAALFAAKQKAEADVVAAEAKVREAKALAEANKTPGYLELEKAKLQLQMVQACAASQNPGGCVNVIGANAGQVNVNPGQK